MSDHIRATIDELKAKIRPMEEKVIKTKQLINLLCEQAELSPLYPEAELTATPEAALPSAEDEYFNKPLNTCLKSVLNKRKQGNRGPATVEEIYEAMLRGGYAKFPNNRDDALTGLRISLGKSSHTFVRLPNGSYGLAEWYDIKRPPRTVKNGEAKSADADRDLGAAEQSESSTDILAATADTNGEEANEEESEANESEEAVSAN